MTTFLSDKVDSMTVKSNQKELQPIFLCSSFLPSFVPLGGMLVLLGHSLNNQ
jgi:hypothetical protein